MEISPVLQELLSRWERQGRPAAEQICQDCPDQVDNLRAAIAALADMADILASSKNDSTESTRDRPNDNTPESPSDSDQPTPPIGDHGLGFLTQSFQTPVTPPTTAAVQYLGRYRLDDCLGKGAFGEVWKGYDPVLDLVVAIKKPRSDRALAPRDIAQFLEEARKQTRLNHRAIVKVRNAEQLGNGWFIVSDFVDGVNLREYAATRTLEFAETVRLVAEIADALHAAHRERLIHRDVKPANILIDRTGRPFLTDFGLALSEDEQQREKNCIAGTYAYMSPEQMRGEGHFLDGRSDIYSLGVVLYELLAGELPFKGLNYHEYREQILARPPKPPRAIRDNIPVELERICLKCLAKSATERYSTAADLASALRASSRSKSFPAVAWLLAGCLLCLLVAALLTRPGFERPEKMAVQPPAEPPAKPPAVVTPAPISVDGWMPLWTRMPEKLMWPGQGSGSLLELKLEEESIWVVCRGHGLLKLGQVDEPDYELSLIIEPFDWNSSRCGVFFGHHHNARLNPDTYVFHMIRIMAGEAHNPESDFLVTRMWATHHIEADGPSATPTGNAKIPHPRQRSGKLEVAISKNVLRSVRWNDSELPSVAIPQANQFGPAQGECRGGYGIYVYDCAVRIIKPRFKG